MTEIVYRKPDPVSTDIGTKIIHNWKTRQEKPDEETSQSAALRCWPLWCLVQRGHREIRQTASEIPEPQAAGAQSRKLPVKILQFLKGSEMQKRRATFTGEIDHIPENLSALLGQLYLHRFTIVRMRIRRDISYTTSELIVVSDAKTGDVVSYLWQGGYDVPESFKQLLTHYPKDVGLRNSEVLSTAFVRLNALANLIVYPDRASNSGYRLGIGGRVGALSAKQKGKVMELSAELIRSLRPYRLLTLQMEETEEADKGRYMYEGHRYGRLAIVNVETGKEM